jgi:hypothetical protein
MSDNDLAARLVAKPFEPFRLVMDDGVSYDVRHPDMVWVTPTSVLVGYPDASRPRVILHYDTVSLLHVSRLEPLARVAVPGQGNGEE